ncbi:hypothetical protein VB620_14040 [Nodularia harveyana UHCC-0300]|uniref:Uncharacterized protein n=1 Tax=Nodularia harveyana UHCC-0300 TaxID=2974287 RepID=A0ABU5UHJ0_9CYAN|nr:hypothetical protein [Nodularia harveyana]MEA5582456.1 hypothetical protein [Nodularia harveyana UHCC-0300]
MKTPLKQSSMTYKARIITALTLSSILSIAGGLTIIKSATADPFDFPPGNFGGFSINQQNNLPLLVANAVRRDVFIREGFSPQRLTIVEYSQETWNDGCLELAQPDEVCTQALVPGWRVVVSNGEKTWVYHTNSNGRLIRLAEINDVTDPSPDLPLSVRDAVLQAAAQTLQLSTSELTIIEFEQRTWNDSCLELGGPAESCLLVLVEGWQVTVGAGDQILVYHTNEDGSAIRLNTEASTITAN